MSPWNSCQRSPLLSRLFNRGSVERGSNELWRSGGSVFDAKNRRTSGERTGGISGGKQAEASTVTDTKSRTIAGEFADLAFRRFFSFLFAPPDRSLRGKAPRLLFAQRPHQCRHRIAQRLVFELRKIPHELDGRPVVAAMRHGRCGLLAVEAVEEIRDIDRQGATDLEQAPCADAVGAGLVFLDLLVGNPQDASHILLREPHLGAPVSDAFADMAIDATAVRLFLYGRSHPKPQRAYSRDVLRFRVVRWITGNPLIYDAPNSIYSCIIA